MSHPTRRIAPPPITIPVRPYLGVGAPRKAAICYAMLRYAMLCYAMLHSKLRRRNWGNRGAGTGGTAQGALHCPAPLAKRVRTLSAEPR
eukprot:3623036-Pyramimonas_sp.AAC.1